MQFFELHFNPKLREDRFFDSFVYEPENIYEKKLGSLYIIGELQNTLPQNAKLLDNLARTIKKNYYTLSAKSPEKALSQSLKKANEFLSDEVKKENVSWLGNLNFTVLSLKDFNLTFAKTGDLKILLLREGQVIDVGKNLDLQEIDPYPLKIFFNVVSGKLTENDLILVLTKEVFKFFSQQNLLNKLAALEPFNEKNLRKILPSQLFSKGEGLKVSGICFLAVLKEEAPQRQPKEIILQKQKTFSWSQVFSPLFKRLKTIGQAPKNLISPICSKTLSLINLKKKKKHKKKKKPSRRIPLPKIPKIELFTLSKIKTSKNKRRLILISILIFLLFVGFLIFEQTERRKKAEIKASLEKIQEKVLQAEDFLIFKSQEKANSLFKEAWQDLLPLTEQTSLKKDILSLKESIEEKLERLNKLEKIENPELLLELKPEELEFTPQKLLLFNSELYFYAPASPNLYTFNLTENKGSTFKANKNLESGDILDNSILFFSRPNILISFKNGSWQEKTLQPPESNLFSSYISNLYFLDKNTCEITKYLYLGGLQWGSPQTWLENKGPENSCLEPKSMTVNGSIWILNKDNSISRFHAGNYQETINLDIFPLSENITKIKTKVLLPYLYFSEPIKNRIIITDKTGKIVKQFQSEKFDSIKDFEISDNGKTIWLLNDLKVYQIKL